MNSQGITLVWGYKSRNFPCPIFHDVMITNWGPEVEGQYNIIPWSKERIRSWQSRDRRWDRFKGLNQNEAGKLLLRLLVSHNLIQEPGPNQQVTLSYCMADVYEMVQITAITANNLKYTKETRPSNIGIQDTVIQDS